MRCYCECAPHSRGFFIGGYVKRFVPIVELYGVCEQVVNRVRDVVVAMCASHFKEYGLPQVEVTAGCMRTNKDGKDSYAMPSVQVNINGKLICEFPLFDAEEIKFGNDDSSVVKTLEYGIVQAAEVAKTSSQVDEHEDVAVEATE